MKHLKQFLTRLQTFELRLIHRKEAVGPLGLREVSTYDIRHETPYDEAAVFESELRLLAQMAALDLLPLRHPQLQLVLEQITGIEDRFRAFWVSFHNHAPDYGRAYPAGHLHQLSLPELFVLRNLQPIEAGIAVREELVDDLGESVKLRESLLAHLIRHVQALLPTPQEAATENTVPARPVTGHPRFVDGVRERLFEVLKGYFTPGDQQQLLALLEGNHSPASPLLFHGNGNQLADAFKQLYEANLIVGCLKGELESWIAAHFAYVYRKQQRTLPPNYLAAIISSNAKPCQSPILDVRKQPDGTYAVYPVLRTQKNYN
ncbi:MULTISPECIES: hypothetical protein [Pontibacter]|uniref:Uncharacterized protein n=2 Tax=Pontibacter TaxID=323449 RepID=A0A2U1B4Q6_9BACT|nr:MULTISPECIES: hypothetical protein [Pontibacter]MBF8961737.1 hypothetical protein [Pontibacter sp. FD36]PVY43659.1 hypothetical protein C8E01_10115 [Pontibacter virosus]GGG18831.1 hypothetical protein GCM10011323_23730 [Pontibacter amylolyticus]